MTKKKNYAVVLENRIVAVFLDKQAAITYNKLVLNHVENNNNTQRIRNVPEILHDKRVRLIEFVTIEDNIAEIIET